MDCDSYAWLLPIFFSQRCWDALKSALMRHSLKVPRNLLFIDDLVKDNVKGRKEGRTFGENKTKS